MRPGEIDYARTAKPYFDLHNGEVLMGEKERKLHIAQGASPDNIGILGELLRDPEEVAHYSYEPLDVSLWEPERFIKYGQWLRRIVSAPKNGRWITRQTIANGENLGVGPGEKTIKSHFNTITDYYAALQLGPQDAMVRGRLNHWTLDDYADYVRRLGNGKPPTLAMVNDAARADTSKPSIKMIEQKYPNIKFPGLLKYAGFTGGLAVIRSWSKDEYLAWGVRFMEANGGEIPTALSMDYFSTLKLGPSSAAGKNIFGSVPEFQKEASIAYWDKRARWQESAQAKLGLLDNGIENGSIPAELLCDCRGSESATSLVRNLRESLHDENRSHEVNEALSLYAKYTVLNLLVPSMATSRKLAIATTTHGKEFVVAIRQSNDILPSTIETTALTYGYFDDIWDVQAHLPSLELGAGYHEYYRHRHEKSYTQRKIARARKPRAV